MSKEKVIAVDIGASKVRIQTVDKNGGLGSENLTSLISLDMDNAKFTKLLSDNIKPIVDAEKDSIVATSIGSPGPLDPIQGVIEDAPNLKGVKNLRIVEELKEIFNLPVFLLNDADAATIGEWWLGAGQGISFLNYITLSSGVGSGNLINGKLQRGLGKAPEAGHIDLAIENEGRRCACGQWSHAESFLGTEGLAKTYAKIFEIKEADLTPELRHSVSPKMREGIASNDPRWLKVQEKYSQHLAHFLRNIIMMNQPQMIILGGGIAYGNEPLLAKTKEKLREFMDPRKDKMVVMAEGVQIVLAKLENPVNLGAAKYAFDLLKSIKTGEAIINE